jgi:MFS family permease
MATALPLTRRTSLLHGPTGSHRLSWQSKIGLLAANFFLAEVTGVLVPFLSKYLVERGWKDGSVGLSIAFGGLGVFLMQTPAGFLVDRICQRRALLAGASLVLGLCCGLVPLVPAQ